jgi:hypothetical protein
MYPKEDQIIDKLKETMRKLQKENEQLKERLKECEYLLGYVDIEWHAERKMRDEYFKKYKGEN